MIHKFKIFGYHVIISREPMRMKPRDKRRNAYRNAQRNLRLEMAGHRCEVCGAPIDKSCHIHRCLPAGARDRNKVENITVMCGECYAELQKKPHIHGYQHLEDNTRYDAED